MKSRSPSFIIGLLGALLLLSTSVFIVEQRQQALVLQFGEAVRVEQTPGLKFKVPLIQTVRFFDKRLLHVLVEDKEVITHEKKRLIVNAFVKYRITDPLRFYQAVRDEQGAAARLNAVINAALRRVIGEAPLEALLTERRRSVMAKIEQDVNLQARGFGMNVQDVRITRTDLPKENSDKVYERMRSERDQEAARLKAEGLEAAAMIVAEAERERVEIVSEAQRQAETIRGVADASVINILGEIFGKDPHFFEFYRSLQLYRVALNQSDTTLFISSDSDFLRHMDIGASSKSK